MKHGSLFSGIGGFDLAAEWMGWENVFHCEWNEFGQKVLKHYWPKAETYGDITKTDFTKWRGSIDIITGGFPCQPYSNAGKRRGKDDERHLWPEMLRAIREIAPRYIVGENVFGITSWNGGVVFNEVHTDLEAEGYDVQTVVIPAAGKNAPHGRDRVWFVAYSNGHGPQRINSKHEERTSETRINALNDIEQASFTDSECRGGIQRSKDLQSKKSNGAGAFSSCREWDASNPNNERLSEWNGQNSPNLPKGNQSKTQNRSISWETFPTQSPICGGDDGLPTELDGITFSKWRAESVKAYGNAIVPHVAYEIFKAIERID